MLRSGSNWRLERGNICVENTTESRRCCEREGGGQRATDCEDAGFRESYGCEARCRDLEKSSVTEPAGDAGKYGCATKIQ